jgi:hypothetical protein
MHYRWRDALPRSTGADRHCHPASGWFSRPAVWHVDPFELAGPEAKEIDLGRCPVVSWFPQDYGFESNGAAVRADHRRAIAADRASR